MEISRDTVTFVCLTRPFIICVLFVAHLISILRTDEHSRETISRRVFIGFLLASMLRTDYGSGAVSSL